MKTFTKFSIAFTTCLIFLFSVSVFGQLEFTGNYADGMGGAGWNADGSGPEPYGYGHGTIFYYVASLDYLDGEDHCGAELTQIFNGFPLFQQSLVDNGFSLDQVTVKFALSDLGDDIEGIDYFTVDVIHYCNFYPAVVTLELDGEELLEGTGNYIMYITGPGVRKFQSGFLKVSNIYSGSGNSFQNVADALLLDIAGEELQLTMQLSNNVAIVTGNGRSGAYVDVSCTLEKGLPEIPLKGLYSDNEGFAGWDADGTGPEPEGDGHDEKGYYVASVDYMDIIPDGNFVHFLEGQSGFLNTQLQLQYRGFEIGDLKLKLGLGSLGPDKEGEDYGETWRNYYNNEIIFEINAETILSVLLDTNLVANASGTTSAGMVYDISENASADAQFVAQSILKDLGTHQLRVIGNYVYAGVLLEGDGRDGGFYNVPSGKIQAVHEQATFVAEGPVSGDWTMENSPYYIEGPVTIENNQTLTIEPGVRVATRGAFPITVQGNVIAEGTAENPIMFTASNPNIFWDGFDYDQTLSTNDTSVFQNCVFKYSSAQGYYPYNSGGVFAVREFNKILIDHSIFYSNEALQISGGYSAGGAAIALWDASPVIRRSEFNNNTSTYGGAIFCFENSNPEISRNLFYNNTAEDDGGAIQIWGNSNPNIIHNTFSLNNAGNVGGAVDVFSNSNPEFINNIFWGNTAGVTGQQISISSADCDITIKYCNVEGGEAGIGPNTIQNGIYKNNIDQDPLFIDPENYVFLLDNLAPSPCIDTGDPLSPDDPDGSAADMGCYYQSLGKIQGFVRDAQTNLTIDNAIVTAQNTDYGAATYSTPFGSHYLLRLPGGTYNITCEAAGYQSQTINNLSIPDAETTTQNFYLNPTTNFFTELESEENIASTGIFPNPFKTKASIVYALLEDSGVWLQIQDLNGQEMITLVDAFQEKGIYQVTLDGSSLEPGVYFCVLKSNGKVQTTKVIKL